MENIVSLCKRRGFVFPSSDIYGGLANTWDFGHYGILLKNNLRDRWWNEFVLQREDMFGLEASILLNPRVWESSGHLAGFSDAMVDCKGCKHRTRADHLIEDQIEGIKVEGLPKEKLTSLIVDQKLICPNCGKSDFTAVRNFNLLFETKLGILEESKSRLFLRGEIAQGIFINFKNVINSMRAKLPFGIAQQGKAFRNEITMGQFIHRTAEFDLMEFEYFIYPEVWEKTFQMWQDVMWNWAISLGINEKKLRWREHKDFERSFYSTKTVDLEYQYPFGWKEMFGIAYRTDYDIKNHMLNSKKDLSYIDSEGKKVIPHVIEPTFGLSRLLGVILADAYTEEVVEGKKPRTVLKLSPSLSPVKASVFPLQKDEKLTNFAKKIYTSLKQHFFTEFDNSGNIGKMYRRQDEIGTPYCITVDYQSLDDNTVTVRDRDSMHQDRLSIDSLVSYILSKIK